MSTPKSPELASDVVSTPTVSHTNMSVGTSTVPFFALWPDIKFYQYWHYPLKDSTLFVQIVVDHPLMLRGTVICDHVASQPLKDTAPAILQYLTTDGTRLIFPCSEAIDKDVFLELVARILQQHSTGVIFDLDFSTFPHDPIKLIKLHIILVLFGLDDLANDLLARLWVVLESRILTPNDVFWVWTTCGPSCKESWLPSHANDYIQRIAWAILKADTENNLNPEVKSSYLQQDHELKFFTKLLEERYRKFGLGREPLKQTIPRRTTRTVSDKVEEHRDTAIELSERIDVSTTPVYTPAYEPPLHPLSPPFISPFVPGGSPSYSMSYESPLNAIVTASPDSIIFPKSTNPWHRTPQHGGIEVQYEEGPAIGE
jgi:hypothetical protein